MEKQTKKYYIIDEHYNVIKSFHLNKMEDIDNIEIIPNKTDVIFSRLCSIVITVIVTMFCMGFIILDKYNQIQKDREELKQTSQQLKQALVEKEFDENILKLIGESSLNEEKLSVQAIYELAKKAGAYYPEVIAAQAIIESGLGNSNVYKNTNNLYGMKIVNSNGRLTTQSKNKTYNGYGVYHNWQMSTIDRVLYDVAIFKNKPTTRQEYINKLSKIYCKETPSYAEHIYKVLSSMSKTY